MQGGGFRAMSGRALGCAAAGPGRRHLDALSALPVIAGVFAAIAPWFAPWYRAASSRMPGMGERMRLDGLIEGVRLAVASVSQGAGGPVPALAPDALAAVQMCVGALQTTAVLSAVCGAVCALVVLVCRERAARPARILSALACVAPALALVLLPVLNASVARSVGAPVTLAATTYAGVLCLTWVPVAELVLCGGCAVLAPRLLHGEESRAAAEFYAAPVLDSGHGIGGRARIALVVIAVVAPLLMVFGRLFMGDRSQIFIGFLMAIASMAPVVARFESRRPQARELLLIAVIVSMSVAGRLAFFMLPQFKPMAAFTIIAGIWLGAETGALVGMMSGFVSNFFFGQGPWTPWQMLALGIIGFLAGVLFRRDGRVRTRSRLAICAYGGASTLVIYGLLADTSSALVSMGTFDAAAVLGVYLAGLPFNVMHALSTVVFLYVLALPLGRKLERVQRKYGILLG